MDPFTAKEIAEAASEAQGSDIPEFKNWETQKDPLEKSELSDFDDLGDKIPDFGKTQSDKHIATISLGGEGEERKLLPIDGGENIPDFGKSGSDISGHLAAEQILGSDENLGLEPMDRGKDNIPDFGKSVETAEPKSPWDEVPQTIDENTGRTKIELTSGTDREILNAVPPPGNADIRVYDADGKNYIDVQTDEAGRKVHVFRPELNIAETSQRDSNETSRCTDIMDGRVDENGHKLDDGGHLVADLFGGSSEQTNLVPMDSEVNRHGGYRAMEREIAEALSEEPPHKVTDFEVSIHYEDDTQRPSGFTYSYKLDGKDVTNYVDNNVA